MIMNFGGLSALVLALAFFAALGCYDHHVVSLGVPVTVTAGEAPIADATVVAEDCLTGERAQATTDVSGIAFVRLAPSACWNITVAEGRFLRSVLGAPVPLEGPIALPPRTEPSGGPRVRTIHIERVSGASPSRRVFARTAFGAFLEVPHEGGELHIATSDLPWRAGIHTAFEVDDQLRAHNMTPFALQPPNGDGVSSGRIEFGIPGPVRSASLRVRVATDGVVDFTTPPLVAGGFVLAESQLDETITVGLAHAGSPSEEGPDSRTYITPFRWFDASLLGPGDVRSAPIGTLSTQDCEPIWGWRGATLTDGAPVEVGIPRVERFDVAGTTLGDLRVEIDAPGHRAFATLTLPGRSPYLSWRIEEYTPGALSLDALPPVPSTHRDTVENGSDVMVVLGLEEPSRASYVNEAPEPFGFGWERLERFIVGDPTPFPLDGAACPIAPTELE